MACSPGPSALVIKRIVGVGSVDDLAEQNQGGIAGQLVFLQDRLERAFLAVVAEFHVFHVVRNCIKAFGFVHHFVGRHKDEIGFLVDEFPDEPWTGYTIDLDVFAGDPFHWCLLEERCSVMRSTIELLLDCCAAYLKSSQSALPS